MNFFDTLGEDILKVVEDCRINGKMYEAFNTTFIALIPKSDNPISFDDFRPISLCNCIYKIIAKIIANRICLFARSTDPRGCWNFTRSTALYSDEEDESVLVNGATSPLFHLERGLRHGCPLSPLLFLLIMEGLSRLIKEEHTRGRLKGIRIIDRCILTHLLFVDDVLIFLNGGIGDLTMLQNTFSLFQTATGRVINNTKSTIIATGCSPHEIQYALHRFPFTLLQMEDGRRYLGYKLKPNGYNITD
eukprot:PITA_31755